MRNSLKTTAAAFMLVAVTGLTGCATTRDLDALKLEVEKAQAAAMRKALEQQQRGPESGSEERQILPSGSQGTNQPGPER